MRKAHEYILHKTIPGITVYLPIRDSNNLIQDFELVFFNSTEGEKTFEDDLKGKGFLKEIRITHAWDLFNKFVKVFETGETLNEIFSEEIENDKHWYLTNAVRWNEMLVVNLIDITQQKRSEEEYRKSEQAYKLLAENYTDWIYRIDISGNYVYSSHSSIKVVGYTPEELTGNPFYEFIHPEDIAPLSKAHRKLIEKPEIVTSLSRFKTKNGNFIWLEATNKPIIDLEGKVVEIQSSGRDITERKKTEEALNAENQDLINRIEHSAVELTQNRSLLNLITDYVPALFVYLNKNLKFEYINKTFIGWFDDEIEKIIGKPFEEVLGGSFLPSIKSHLYDLLLGKKISIDQKIKDKNGEEKYVKLSLIPDKNDEGKIKGYVILMVDVTEERRAQEKAQFAMEKLYSVINQNPVVFWAVNTEGIFTISEGKGLEALGLKPGEIVGKSAFDIFKDHPTICKNIKRALKGEAFSFTTKVNDLIYEDYYGPMKDFLGNIIGVSGISTDISERIKMENELMASEAKYKAMAEGIPQMVWTALPHGVVDYVNQNWCRYVGKTFEEALKYGPKNSIHPDDVQLAEKLWNDSLQSGKPYINEQRVKRAADGHYRWHLARAWPAIDSSGKIIKWLGTTTDIHDQKEQNEELKCKNKELVRTNADLDNFVYTASHDLKAPIANIEGLLSVIKNEMTENCGEHILELMQMTEESLHILQRTINELTEISQIQRSEEEDVSEVDIKKTIEEFQIEYRDQVKTNNANFITDLRIEKIKFSKKNFKSIIYNLLSNSIKYRHPQRAPEIIVETKFIKQDCMLLTVSDNGLGFDTRNKEKIFKMFKRLHNHVEGTGIGLYIIKRIIENNGGKIEVESEIGTGTTFKIFLKIV